MAKLKVPDLPGKPHQPVSFLFPKRTFGQKKIALRSFQLCGISHGLGCNTTKKRMLFIAIRVYEH